MALMAPYRLTNMQHVNASTFLQNLKHGFEMKKEEKANFLLLFQYLSKNILLPYRI
jgi:hypothetical protein